jgi:hypothetical protein
MDICVEDEADLKMGKNECNDCRKKQGPKLQTECQKLSSGDKMSKQLEAIDRHKKITTIEQVDDEFNSENSSSDDESYQTS